MSFFLLAKSWIHKHIVQDQLLFSILFSLILFCLGEILFYEDSMTAEGIAFQMPVWRQDNFNVHDSLHISDIEQLYSNYDIQFYEQEAAVISIKNLYSHARNFVRLITFDTNGYQRSDTTFYNIQFGELIHFNENKILVLKDPEISSFTHRISEKTGFTCTCVLLNKDFKTIKIVKEPRYGMRTNYLGYALNGNRLQLTFEVEDGCGGCRDEYWWLYNITINADGDLVNVEKQSPPNIIMESHPSIDEFRKSELEAWRIAK